MTRHVRSMYNSLYTSLRVFAKTNWNFKCYNYIYFERDDVKCVCEHVLLLFTTTSYYYILELRTTRVDVCYSLWQIKTKVAIKS